MKNDKQVMKLPEMYDAICASGGVLCVYLCMIACICMFSLAQQRWVSGLWAVCKSQRLGGRENHRLIPQLFPQPLFWLDSLIAYKENCPVHKTHTNTFRQADKCTWRAYWQWTEVFLCRPVSEVPAPGCSLSSHRGPQWEMDRNSTPASGS